MQSMASHVHVRNPVASGMPGFSQTVAKLLVRS